MHCGSGHITHGYVIHRGIKNVGGGPGWHRPNSECRLVPTPYIREQISYSQMTVNVLWGLIVLGEKLYQSGLATV